MFLEKALTKLQHIFPLSYNTISLFFEAVEDGNDSSVTAMLEHHGARLVHTLDSRGDTPLMTALFCNQLRLMDILLANGANIDARSKEGSTALIRAAAHSEPPVIDFLLRHHADVNAYDNDKTTALIAAAWNGKEQNIKRLLEAGADPSFKDAEGKTAQDWAEERGYPLCADIFTELKKAEADKRADQDVAQLYSGTTTNISTAGKLHLRPRHV